MNTISTFVNHQPLKATGSMRSPRGFWGTIVLLALPPLALSYGMIFANGFDTFIHWALATGTLLLALAVFDFNKLPQWLNCLGCLLMGIEAAIFFVQGLSDLLHNEALAYVAYQVLGQGLEGWLIDLLLLWFIALLVMDSQGKSGIVGLVVMSVVVGVEVYRYSLSYLGTSLDAEAPLLKVLILLPFVWFLLESKERLSPSMRPEVG